MNTGLAAGWVTGLLAYLVSVALFAQEFPAALSDAVTALHREHVPGALLPTQIPALVSRYGIKRVIVERTRSGYSVALYYSTDTSDATFAGMLSGSSVVWPRSSLLHTTSVRLADGTHGRFRPVSCGGSCAPANLWWARGGYQYNLQLRMGSALDEREQLRALLGMADSMEPVP